jgi:4-aminobutyrate aminotransferase/(S)-3-amino-2-methylpropionate transaminase
MTTNAELKARQGAAVPKGVASKGIYAARAENAELWDVEGRRYVDFAAGIAVTNTGHRHPKVMAAVAEQAQAFTHTCVHVSDGGLPRPQHDGRDDLRPGRRHRVQRRQ